MPDSYFLESFIGGLTTVVKPLVRAFNPQTLSAAIDYARYQEEPIQALKIPLDRPPKSLPIYSKPIVPTPAPFAQTIQNTSGSYKTPINCQNFQKPTRFIPASERAEKIAKGLCCYCDQSFERGHKCGNNGKQLYLIEVMGEEDEVIDAGEFAGEVDTGEFTREVEFDKEETMPQISMNAMNGSIGFHTIRVNGHVGKRTLRILIDLGSTHNFLDENLAKKLGCRLESVAAQSVTIAGGQQLQCHYIYRRFKWLLHGIEFDRI